VADSTFVAPPLHLRAARLNGFVRLLVSGELDLATGGYLEETLVRLQQEHATVIVDLAGLTFMGAEGLRIFLDAARRAGSTKGILVIVNCHGGARKLFELSSASDLLDPWAVSELFDDRDWTPMQLAPVEPPATSVAIGA
jgi:anti-anti-sigma factor